MTADEPTAKPSRFLLLDDVAAELSTSKAQVYALVRSKRLPAIKIGGRGQWRIERTKLEAFITQAYDDTAAWIDANPFGPGDAEPDPDV